MSLTIIVRDREEIRKFYKPNETNVTEIEMEKFIDDCMNYFSLSKEDLPCVMDKKLFSKYNILVVEVLRNLEVRSLQPDSEIDTEYHWKHIMNGSSSLTEVIESISINLQIQVSKNLHFEDLSNHEEFIEIIKEMEMVLKLIINS